MSSPDGRATTVEDFPPARLRAVALAYRKALEEAEQRDAAMVASSRAAWAWAFWGRP